MTITSDLNRLPLSEIIEAKEALRPAQVKSPEYAQLRENIRTNGVQSPIVVRPTEDGSGKYLLLDGAQRYSCSKDLGLADIPATILRNVSDEKAFLLQVSLNVARVTTKPAECGAALKRVLLRDPLLTVEKLAEASGFSVGWVNQMLKLADLEPGLQKLINDGSIAALAGLQLVRLPVEERQSWIERAMTMSVQDLQGQVDARIKEIRDATRQGRDPNAQARFVPVARLRKFPAVREVFEDTTRISAIIEGAQTPMDAARLMLEWCMSLDAATIAAARAKFEGDLAARKEAKAKKSKKSEVETLAKAARTLIGAGTSRDSLPEAMQNALVEVEKAEAAEAAKAQA